MSYLLFNQSSGDDMPPPTKCKAVPSKLIFKRVRVNPTIANKWLTTRDLNNRFVRKNKVKNDAEDMLEGRWHDNGEVIKIAVPPRGKELMDGELLDGVHRCLAIVGGNIEIELWVAFNVEKAAMPTIDIGSARSFQDYLRMAGESNATAEAAITRRLYLWRRPEKPFRHTMKVPGHAYPSMPLLKETFEKNADNIRFSTKIGDDIRRKTQFMKIASAGLFFLLTAEVDLDQALEFKDRLLDGKNLKDGNPIGALRTRLLSYGANNLTDLDRLAMSINAWNLWRTDTAAETIYRTYGESGKGSSALLTNENFPEPM